MQNNNTTTSNNNMLMHAGVQQKKKEIKKNFSTFKDFTFLLFSNLKIPLCFFEVFHVHDICARSRSLLHVVLLFFCV